MATIASENQKPIRQALTVLCGMDVEENLSASATAADSYDGRNGDVSGVPLFSQFMDLSGGGFLNDGSAIPLDQNHNGIVATVDSSNVSELALTIHASQYLYFSTAINIYYYENNEELKKKTINMTGLEASTTIRSEAGRINVVKVTAGSSWWFTNSSLISCTLSLRGVETKAENPELQLSDIEIVGYEPENVIEKISMIGPDKPIYYTSGYPGDMAPVRKFYLSSNLSWEDKKLTIKGEDASKFLDEQYEGKYIGDGSAMNGGNAKYIEAIHSMIEDAGIEHVYLNDYVGAPYDTGSAILLQNRTKRETLAQAVNMLHCDLKGSGSQRAPLYLNYVDAGLPKLWTGRNTTDYELIEDIAELKIDTEAMPNKITLQAYVPVIEPAEEIETATLAGSIIKETTEPYYSFSTSRGTIQLIGPYKYRLEAAGEASVSGRRISFYNRTTSDEGYIATKDEGYRTIKLEDFVGWQYFTEAPIGNISDVLDALLNREIITYSFRWRGNPKMQPRDHIKVLIDNELINMTVDTVTLEHEDGGLTSQIYARKGWI